MTIMAGIDNHVNTLVSEIGHDKKNPEKKTFKNTNEGHLQLINRLKELQIKYNATRVLVAYEASGLSYLLHDKLKAVGFDCAVLAPTELLRSATGFKKKTDKKDASYIYETVRGHVLAGNSLHDIWIPDKELRGDRDIVRSRFDLGKKITHVKLQVHTHLKKNGIRIPDELDNWTGGFYIWLDLEAKKQSTCFQICLNTLLRQLKFLETEAKAIEKEMRCIGRKARYNKAFNELMKIKGVGLITAMTFLTEMGDVNRFSNRKQVGAYLGLVPSSHESGDADDRKGRITRDGPYRLRSVLNQATWAHLRYNGEEKAYYDKIAAKNPKRKKKAVVACMRRLAIRMWHCTVNVTKEELLDKAC